MHKVSRRGEAELSVFFVVASVGKIKGSADLDNPRVFNSASFFVVGLRRQYRIDATREVDSIRTFSVAEPRCPRSILRAIEHHKLSVMRHDRRIESAGGFPSGTLRCENRSLRCALPCAEGPACALREREKWHRDDECHDNFLALVQREDVHSDVILRQEEVRQLR